MIPTYQEFMLPLLQALADGQDHTTSAVQTALADRFDLSDDDRKQLMPGRRQPLLNNRIGWAQTYLKKAGLLDAPRRGTYRITQRGRELLNEHPSAITSDLLMRYPEFAAFRTRRMSGASLPINPTERDDESTPEELLELGYQRVRQSLADELLAKVKASSPEFFERLVVDLLVRMGYGGSQEDAGKAIGKSGDGGIDGIIKEDRLGLDVIYLQAKRWEGGVGRPEIQKFVGALQGQRAKKGVFLTTATFTPEAVEYVRMIDVRIVLVAGKELAELMIDHGVGVATFVTYDIKKLDQEFFAED